MKKYETPEISFEELKANDVIAGNFVEGGDNETPWIEGWASAINDIRN